MKKVSSLILVAMLLIVSLSLGYSSNSKNQIDSLILENVEAIASGEIIVGPFCMITSHRCVVFPDGLYLNGIPQPW